MDRTADGPFLTQEGAVAAYDAQMTANPLTPEHVSEVAEEIAATLPPEVTPTPIATPAGLTLPKQDKGPPHITEIWLVDQYGNKVASGQLQVPVVPIGGAITIPGITIVC